jgi:hypothetical protein
VTRPGLPLALALSIAAGACGGGGGGDGDANPGPDGVPGPVMVSGVVRYEDRAPQANGSLAQPVPRAARFVAVALVNLAGDTLGESTTAADGSFTIVSTVDVTYGDSIHILAATMSDDPARPVDVVRPDGNVHGFGDAGFAAAADHYTEVLITESSGEAGAFNVFDKLVEATDYAASLGLAPRSLTAEWARNSQDGTYYDGNGTMHLLGASSDDDGYDDTVILHEAGHWFEDSYGRSDSPGGGHDGSPTDPNLAWSEGFSTYFSMVVNGGVPLYVDSNAAGGWSFNGDTSVTRAMGTGIAQDVSEDMVVEILWDLGDTSGGDDDPFTGAHLPVVEIQPAFLRTATLRNVGEAGVDLVDFLDGFFVADGLTNCADVDSIVTVTRTFPYDYNGPAGPCP